MLGKDLLSLEFNDRTGCISELALRQLLPNFPTEVLRQILVDHGRKDHIQNKFCDIDLTKINWEIHVLQAKKIAMATCHPSFENWVSSVKKRCKRFQEIRWPAIDARSEVVTFWEHNKTWKLPPMYISGFPGMPESTLCLVEGHTRHGVLLGLLEIGEILSESKHSIWIGTVSN